MKHFAPIALPLTVKRSALAYQLRRHTNQFAVMLAQLDPKAYDGVVANGTVLDFYYALLEHCETLFPCWRPCFDEEFSEDDEYTVDEDELIYQLGALGIPVYPVGMRNDEAYYGNSAAIGAISYFVVQPATRMKIAELRNRKIGKSWTHITALEPWHDRYIERKMIYPPKDQVWSGHWSMLEWLVKFVQADTGYQWLDLSSEDMDEGGNSPWSLADIDFLTNDWADAELIWKPLHAFIKWLDAKPETRLPMAIAALMGDEQVRQRLCEPKPTGKTLGEVFLEEEIKRNQKEKRRSNRA